MWLFTNTAGFLAVAAAPAGAYAGHQHAVADRQSAPAGADLLHGADGLVPEYRAWSRLGHVALEDVQVAATEKHRAEGDRPVPSESLEVCRRLGSREPRHDRALLPAGGAFRAPRRGAALAGVGRDQDYGNEERVYRSRTNAFVALTGVSPAGVKVPLAVSLSRLECLSCRLPVAVSLILIVAVPAAEKLC